MQSVTATVLFAHDDRNLKANETQQIQIHIIQYNISIKEQCPTSIAHVYKFLKNLNFLKSLNKHINVLHEL